MASLNKVFLLGNLTRDVELRYTPQGMAVADLNMAINRTFARGGEQKEETCFVNVVVWGRTAELCNQYLAKGSTVLVEGSLQYDQWQTDAGERRSRLRVRADRVQFLGRLRKAEVADAPASSMERPSRAMGPESAGESAPMPPEEGLDENEPPF